MSWLRGISTRVGNSPKNTSGNLYHKSQHVKDKSGGLSNINNSVKTTSSLYVSNVNQGEGGSCLLLVDPQNDFVTGSLAIEGAIDDCKRIADFISRNEDNIQEIYVTMDTHMRYHIAHPLFWRVGNTDDQPTPFTNITNADISKGKYRPVNPNMKKWVLEYTRKLESGGKFTLTIWPPHCLIGTEGHNVVPVIAEALKNWESSKKTCAHYIFKGNNSKTEHYSAFKAEVEVSDDKTTKYNRNLLKDLKRHGKIYIAGEARSHCVNFTTRDLVRGLGEKAARQKIVLLEGGMTDVTGCKAMGDTFWKEMTSPAKLKGKEIPTQDIRRAIVVTKEGLRRGSVIDALDETIVAEEDL